MSKHNKSSEPYITSFRFSSEETNTAKSGFCIKKYADNLKAMMVYKTRYLFKHLHLYMCIVLLTFLISACQNGLDHERSIVTESDKQPEQEVDVDEENDWVLKADQSLYIDFNHEPNELDAWIYDSLEVAISAWIEQLFLENPERGKYNFAHVETVSDSEAVVIVGMCCSELDCTLEFKMKEGQWNLVQKRAIPHSGYDVVRELRRTRDELVDLFGEPNRMHTMEELNNSYYTGDYYYFYDHLQTGFFIGGEPAVVQGIELLGCYYCFSIAAGNRPDYIIQQLGEPSSQSYSENAKAEGYPPYVRFYNFSDIKAYLESVGQEVMIEYLLPEFEGDLDLHFFSECEDSRIEIILATYTAE